MMTHKFKDLIIQNKLRDVFESLAPLVKSDRDLSNQTILLAAKYNDLRKRESLGLISLSEASLLRVQINHAVLEIIDVIEKEGLAAPSFIKLPSTSRRVFISYNHCDKRTASSLKQRLESINIGAIVDSDDMLPGMDIKEFIDKSIAGTDVTISIVSKKSLLSAWVAMESLNTFLFEATSQHKRFIACYKEKSFFSRNFTSQAMDFVDRQLKEIEDIKSNRARDSRNTRDLNNEYTRLKELNNGIDEIIRRLRESLCIDISGGISETNFLKIVKSINE